MKLIPTDLTTAFVRGVAADIASRVKTLREALTEAGFNPAQVEATTTTAGAITVASAEQVFLQAAADLGGSQDEVLAVCSRGATMAALALDEIGARNPDRKPEAFFVRMSREGRLGLADANAEGNVAMFEMKEPEGEN